MLFDAIVHGQVVESNLPIKEHVETKLIVKVAHEVYHHHTYKENLLYILEEEAVNETADFNPITCR